MIGDAQTINTADVKAFNDYFKSNEKNFKLIKKIDSLNETVSYLEKENREKDNSIKKYQDASNRIAGNLKLYDF